MNIPALLGAIGTLLGLVRAAPQLSRLVKAQEALGVSLDTAATSSFVSFGWAAYGLLTGQPFVSLATGCSGIIFGLIALLALRFGRKLNEFRIAPVWLVVLLLAGGLSGKNGLGLVLPVSVLAANLPQIWIAWREGDLADLSLGTWLFSIADGLVWGSYAFLRQDADILTYGIFQLVSSGLIVALKLRQRASQRAAAPGESE